MRRARRSGGRVEKGGRGKEVTRWGRQLECKSWVTFARRPRRHIGSKL
ncbi:MAG: hypothetical protein ACKERG_02735 [Candidatus Hodgkinia cicadicola]